LASNTKDVATLLSHRFAPGARAGRGVERGPGLLCCSDSAEFSAVPTRFGLSWVDQQAIGEDGRAARKLCSFNPGHQGRATRMAWPRVASTGALAGHVDEPEQFAGWSWRISAPRPRAGRSFVGRRRSAGNVRFSSAGLGRRRFPAGSGPRTRPLILVSARPRTTLAVWSVSACCLLHPRSASAAPAAPWGCPRPPWFEIPRPDVPGPSGPVHPRDAGPGTVTFRAERGELLDPPVSGGAARA